ncbi:amidohydrolase family protein [Sphingobacterium chuzhouense]|uniref:Amidohydrolase family protein n=1 Tax=Sphingobacterium chuzhouense TaxID=1742264 RepID=A0ABR7XQU4_9SPHI|nr:amidohydrolase family protein [Sphingobacterium chuzhouense]MBD1421523.1 amidohydrolase family protein [Sphingobacterium chuzhouense]
MRIDSHQHFWIFNADRDAWITDDMEAIRQNFLPIDLAAVLKTSGIDGTIAVQASQSHEETQFLVDLSTMYAMIKGVVGWVDLQSEDIEKHLESFSRYNIIKGFRHVIEGEEDPDFLIRPAFLRGIKALTARQYTYDLLIRPRHYNSTLACVEQNPEQRFVLDHMAKPAIRTKEFDEWATFIEKLAVFPNVYCKISGLVTEADWNNWVVDDFKPYIQHVITCFGKQRVMFGTDWPVCLVAATYEEVMKIVETGLEDFSEEELDAFWGGNAVRFYGIK